MASLLNSTYLNDKPDTFSKIQQKYFSKQLEDTEHVTLNYEEFRAICFDSHEMGRLRERAIKNSSVKFK